MTMCKNLVYYLKLREGVGTPLLSQDKSTEQSLEIQLQLNLKAFSKSIKTNLTVIGPRSSNLIT